MFFRSFCVRRTFDMQNVRHRKNTVKTNTKRTSELLRSDPKSMQDRFAWAPKNVQQSERTVTHATNVLGGSRRTSGAPLECSWAVLEHSEPSRERSWGNPNVSLSRSGRVPAASRGATESIRGRPDSSRSILDRFWSNSGSIWAAGGLDSSI